MTNPIRRLALAIILAAVMPAWADDAPKPPVSSGVSNNNPAPQMHSAGTITGKLGKSSDSAITLKVPELERKTTTGRRGAQMQQVEKDHDYDMASDAKIRWHTLPKKSDGKTYTDQEYQKLREPASAPGYKAEASDLKPGQTVKLYLSKAGKDDKPVVTTVVIVTEAPKPKDSDKSK
jgi:hypothetical protein